MASDEVDMGQILASLDWFDGIGFPHAKDAAALLRSLSARVEALEAENRRLRNAATHVVKTADPWAAKSVGEDRAESSDLLLAIDMLDVALDDAAVDGDPDRAALDGGK